MILSFNTLLKKDIFALLFGGILYCFLAKFSMAFFSIEPQNISLVWLPFGLGVILVQKFGLKASIFIFLASFFSHLNLENDTNLTAIIHRIIPAFADSIAPIISVFLFRKFVKVELTTINELIPFTFFGGIIPTFISGIIITLNWVTAGQIASEQTIDYIIIFMFADTMGLILLYPLFKYFDKLPMTKQEITLFSRDILLGCFLIVLSVQYHFFIFLLYPLLLVTAFHLRMKYLMVILFILTIMTMMVANIFGIHFFGYERSMESLLMTGSFMSTLIFISIGVSLHNAELEHNKELSRTDNLTKALNRKAYDEQVSKLLYEFSRYNTYFSIMLLDADDFKSINDTFGHQAGDKTLIDLSTLIKNHIRNSDYLYRIGGEEFIVLLPHTKLEEAQIVSEKIRSTIEKELKRKDEQTITVSIGLTQVQENDTANSLYSRVDTHQYFAKNNGKNQICSNIAD